MPPPRMPTRCCSRNAFAPSQALWQYYVGLVSSAAHAQSEPVASHPSETRDAPPLPTRPLIRKHETRGPARSWVRDEDSTFASADPMARARHALREREDYEAIGIKPPPVSSGRERERYGTGWQDLPWFVPKRSNNIDFMKGSVTSCQEPCLSVPSVY